MPKFQPEQISIDEQFVGYYNFGDATMWLPRVNTIPTPSASGQACFVVTSGQIAIYDGVDNGWVLFNLGPVS